MKFDKKQLYEWAQDAANRDPICALCLTRDKRGLFSTKPAKFGMPFFVRLKITEKEKPKKFKRIRLSQPDKPKLFYYVEQVI